ncbi:hypothetical protein VVMO6_00779 [Vibrio vulnificus MO6-24/O]|nr:hypothetical protein VVMO6_00779 [Vibrio vulnificus MO6-24/O]MDS1807920.1 hypothetical protein [Vibrio vulnificus]
MYKTTFRKWLVAHTSVVRAAGFLLNVFYLRHGLNGEIIKTKAVK